MAYPRGGVCCVLGSLLALVLLSGELPVFAQMATGTILGTVRDSSGAVVPDATITAQNLETGLTRTSIAGSDGEYRLPALPVGRYNVKIEKGGFSTLLQQGLLLEVSQDLVVDATLQVGSENQEVQVTGEVPLVNTSNAELGGLINEEKMADLPLNGRNYEDLTLLQTGVTQVKTVTVSGIIGPGTEYSSNGAPMRSNYMTLDGAQLNSAMGYNASSAAGTTLGVDGIREYKVITLNFGAEYGMQMGSQMVLVSKGGSNQFHGDVFEFLRNATFDARNFFDYSYENSGKRDPQYQRNNFGGAFGGPIKKDKTFFYAVYEGLREKKGIANVDSVLPAGCHGPAGTVFTNATCPQLALPAGTPSVKVATNAATLLALIPLPNLTATNQYAFTFVQPTNVNYGQIRIDQNFSPGDALFARYTINPSTQTTTRPYPQFTDTNTSLDQFVTLSENHVFSPALLNTARFSYSRTNELGLSYSPIEGPEYSLIPGGAIFGGMTLPGITSGFGPTSQTPFGTIQNILALSDDVFYTKGRHSLKFGMLANQFMNPFVASISTRGSVTFANLANFMLGQTVLFGAGTGPGGSFPASSLNRQWQWYTFGLYGQDDWRVTPRLTVNLGLRWEFNTAPNELNGRGYDVRVPLTDTVSTPGHDVLDNSKKLFSPRIGFAWDVTGRGETSLHGGFGIYYDVGALGPGLIEGSTLKPPLAGSLAVPNLPLTFPMVPPAGANSNNFQEFNYFIKQPYDLQWNLAIDQRLPGNLTMTVAYVGTHGVHIWTFEDGNPCTPSSIDSNGLPTWTVPCGKSRPNPVWGYINWRGSFAETSYNSLQVSVQKRLSKGLQFQTSYTWSRMLDDTQSGLQTDGTGFVAYGGNIHYDWGPSAYDLNQNLRFNLTYHFPDIAASGFLGKALNGWWMGNIVSVQSGYPFSPLESNSRSQSDVAGNRGDRTDLASSYNPSTVITGNPNQWFVPSMFALQPLGRLGDAGRDILRGPGLGEWDFSMNKDTKFPFFGESGALQFRAEFFNILNRANFALPNSTVLAGAITDSTEVPLASAGQITATTGTNRDIQLALKLIF